MLPPTAIDTAFVAQRLTAPSRHDNKYTRGSVLLATGSPTYPGAAVLSCLGAAHCGVGFLRYWGPERCEGLVLSALPEAVVEPGRSDVCVVGSGWDASMATVADAVARDCAARSLPLVVDAGALRGVPEWVKMGARVVATPHPGEAQRIFARLGHEVGRDEIEDDIPGAASRLADALGCIVVLKSAQTCVATPDGTSYAYTAKTAWGATAGAGDVLAGVIASCVALRWTGQGSVETTDLLAQACAVGVFVHATAAALAAGSLESRLGALEPCVGKGHPIVASDIARNVPNAIGALLVTASPGAESGRIRCDGIMSQ